MLRPKLIVFDINGTLIKENTWQKLNMAMGVTKEEDDLLMLWNRERIITDIEGQKILCELYKKRGNIHKKYIQSIVESFTYLPHVKEIIKELQAKGYKLALISGSMDMLVKHIASELKINLYKAQNQFIFDQRNLLTNITTEGNDNEFKLQTLKAICKQENILLIDCMCIGDSANDELLFKATKCGVQIVNNLIYLSSAKYHIKNLNELLNLVI